MLEHLLHYDWLTAFVWANAGLVLGMAWMSREAEREHRRLMKHLRAQADQQMEVLRAGGDQWAADFQAAVRRLRLEPEGG